jgi:hypothetical protein
MGMRRWIHKLLARPVTPARRKALPRRRLTIEPLEGRLAPAVFTVTNLLDDGSAGSLRVAVAAANATPGPDIITFDAGLTGILALTGGQLTVTDSVKISGPGANLLGISGNDASRIFTVNGGTGATITVTIGGLSLIDGYDGGEPGGAIYNTGQLNLNDCALSRNTADEGGGLFNSGTAALTKCTLFANSSSSYGGAVANFGLVRLTNCTLSSNSADVGGGGIFNGGPATLIASNCTLAGNSADNGGGGIFTTGAATLDNTIVSNSPSGQDVDNLGTLTGSHNLIQTSSGAAGLTDTITGDPGLGPLADNGGPTLTQALLGGSPAINAGSNDLVPPGVTTDQRGAGYPRTALGGVDLGAFELQTAGPSITATVYADFAASRQNLGGWTVYLDANGNGVHDPGEVSVVTAADGSYAFREVPPNTTQRVAVEVQPGYYQTAPAGTGDYTIPVGDDPEHVYAGNDFGVLTFSTVSGNISGYLQGTPDPGSMPLAGWTVRLVSGMAIDAGGAPIGSYQADQGFDGGQPVQADDAIDTSGVTDPAPQAVYQSSRVAVERQPFSYTLSGLTPGASYTVRLHFAETYWDAAGARVFDVTINGRHVLTGYDIFAAAGGRDRAVAQSFGTDADPGGTITLMFTSVKDNAQVNGIEVFGEAYTTTTDKAGNYAFAGLRAGAYTVAQVVAPGWRQVAPFTPDVRLQTPGTGDVWALPGGAGVPAGAAVADFDGDGQPDVAVINDSESDRNYLWIYYNGHFDAPYGIPREAIAPGGVPLAVFAGDFDGDGRTDLAVLNYDGSIDFIQNEGNGRNHFQVTYKEWVPDVYPNLNRSDIFGWAAGRFITAVAGVGGSQLVMTYAGVNGNPTLALFSLRNGQPQATFTDFSAEANSPWAITPGDINGDGHLDLLMADAGVSPYVAYGDGRGNFKFQTLSALPPGAEPVVADINGDGLLDVGIVADRFTGQGLFHYAIQNRSGGFTPYNSGVAPGDSFACLPYLVDVDGDFRPDLVWVAEGVGTQALFVARNTGQAGDWFTPDQLTRWSLAPGAQGGLFMVPADLDGDGLPDLVVTDQSVWEIVHNRSEITPAAILLTLDGHDSTGNDFVNRQLAETGGRTGPAGSGGAAPRRPEVAGTVLGALDGPSPPGECFVSPESGRTGGEVPGDVAGGGRAALRARDQALLAVLAERGPVRGDGAWMRDPKGGRGRPARPNDSAFPDAGTMLDAFPADRPSVEGVSRD